MRWKRSNPNCHGNRRDEVALRPPSLKVNFKIIQIWTGCENVRYFHYSVNLKWAAPAQNLRLGGGLDIAAPDSRLKPQKYQTQLYYN